MRTSSTPGTPGAPRTPETAAADRLRRPSAALTAAVLCGLAAVVLLALVVARWAPLLTLDRGIAVELHASAVRHPGPTQVSRVFTDWVWDPWTLRLAVVLAAGLVLWRWPRAGRAAAAGVLIALVVSSVVQQGMKALVGRERPVWPDPVDSAHYAAFPSGHAMTAAVAGVLLPWLAWRFGAPRALVAVGVVVSVVSVLGVGFTRLYLGVHWPSDVLGGWLFGACLAWFTVVALTPGRGPGGDPPGRP
ncbi:phosphatase PAP2 family protein [Streptomyces zingiberis]|uniref:Phosphatase PAP2 family protein n=1 Tax=Streptomyces zingiberis TaxID=2053010 RepID=A0ABX1C1F1_9ACTN|nr:phosphatase PAP2 family protein [Streptomyces zingiberis]NJQ03721.1 phosphatase PAP2 family protein [Streptomyces zingiberis]